MSPVVRALFPAMCMVACVDLAEPWPNERVVTDGGLGGAGLAAPSLDAAPIAGSPDAPIATAGMATGGAPVGGSAGGSAGASDAAAGSGGAIPGPTVTAAWDFEGTALSWTGGPSGTVHVQRGASPQGPLLLLGNASAPPFLDRTAPAGMAVYYVLTVDTAGGTATSAPLRYTRTVNLAINGSFEDDGQPTATPRGWQTWSPSGVVSPSYTEVNPAARYGVYQGVHWSNGGQYQIYTFQQWHGLPGGNYVFSAWAKRSGGQKATTIALKSCRTGMSVWGAVVGDGDWQRFEIQFTAADDCYEAGFWSDAYASQWLYFDGVALIAAP